MAKADYTCADCGASVTISARNRADAARLVSYYEKQGRVCNACHSKARAEENARLAKQARAAADEEGLPALTGTEKQVQWAEAIRAETLLRAEWALIGSCAVGSPAESEEAIDAAMLRLSREISGLTSDAHLRSRAISDVIRLMNLLHTPETVETFVSLLREMSSAAWWIDGRDSSLEHLARAMLPAITARMASAAPVIASDVIAEVEAEALLTPKEPPVTQTIAEIRLVGNELHVHMPEKHEEFRQLMRGMGFVWKSNAWVRVIGAMQGSSTDRAAEAAHRILGKGFMVRLIDTEARAKALSGTFKEEQTRWISKALSGSFTGWCRISWAVTEDFYAPAKKISGARYDKGAVFVPPACIMEVEDFANKYGFALGDGVAEMITAHREAVAHGAVVEHKKKAPPVIKTVSVPQKLAVPENEKVDDELLDNN